MRRLGRAFPHWDLHLPLRRPCGTECGQAGQQRSHMGRGASGSAVCKRERKKKTCAPIPPQAGQRGAHRNTRRVPRPCARAWGGKGGEACRETAATRRPSPNALTACFAFKNARAAANAPPRDAPGLTNRREVPAWATPAPLVAGGLVRCRRSSSGGAAEGRDVALRSILACGRVRPAARSCALGLRGAREARKGVRRVGAGGPGLRERRRGVSRPVNRAPSSKQKSQSAQLNTIRHVVIWLDLSLVP